MAKSQAVQLIAVKIVWVTLMILLFYNLLDYHRIEHYFLTAATFIMLIHVWWGAVFYIRNVGHTKHMIELPVDISLTGLLVMAVFSLDNIVKWFIIFGTFFTIAIIKYIIGLPKSKNSAVRRYISTKIKVESPAILLFYLGAVVGTVFDYAWISQFLSISAFLAQIPFIYLLVFKKKVYRMKFD